MSNIPTTSTTPSKARLQGFALASVMIALMLSLFLEALDQTIVGTAMPRIIAELHGLDRYTWVVTAYVLASMTMIPIVGKLSDQFGRKWFLLGGTALFLAGSLLTGASQTMNQLIIFRAIQGLGAGIGMALVATVVGDLFPPDERARWSSLFGIVYGVSNLFGPTLGGWLTEHGPLLGNLITESSRWRWVFYINLPVGLLAVAGLLLFLPANLSVRTSEWTGWAAVRRTDFLGALLSAIATISLMLGLTWGSSRMFAWSSPQVLGLLAIGVVLFALLLQAERHAAEPILPLDLFRNRVFSTVSLLSMLQMMVLMGLSLYLPLFLQGVLAVSPTVAGLVITPLSVSMVVGARRVQALPAHPDHRSAPHGSWQLLLNIDDANNQLVPGYRVHDTGRHRHRLVLLPLRNSAECRTRQSPGRQHSRNALPGTTWSDAGHCDCGHGREQRRFRQPAGPSANRSRRKTTTLHCTSARLCSGPGLRCRRPTRHALPQGCALQHSLYQRRS